MGTGLLASVHVNFHYKINEALFVLTRMKKFHRAKTENCSDN